MVDLLSKFDSCKHKLGTYVYESIKQKVNRTDVDILLSIKIESINCQNLEHV